MMGLFDPIDWDGNGKHDIFDDVFEYLAFEICTAEDEDSGFDDDYFIDEDEEDEEEIDGFDEDD